MIIHASLPRPREREGHRHLPRRVLGGPPARPSGEAAPHSHCRVGQDVRGPTGQRDGVARGRGVPPRPEARLNMEGMDNIGFKAPRSACGRGGVESWLGVVGMCCAVASNPVATFVARHACMQLTGRPAGMLDGSMDGNLKSCRDHLKIRTRCTYLFRLLIAIKYALDLNFENRI